MPWCHVTRTLKILNLSWLSCLFERCFSEIVNVSRVGVQLSEKVFVRQQVWLSSVQRRILSDVKVIIRFDVSIYA